MTKKQMEENIYLRNVLLGKINKKITGFPSKDKPHLKDYPEKAFREKFPKMTMYEYLYERNKNNMNDIAMIFDTGFSETKITFKELFENIDKVATQLKRRGIKKDDKIAVSLVNIPESTYVLYAINKIGAVSCLIDPRSKEYSLERDLKELNVKMYIGVTESYKKIKNIKKKINLENIILIPTIKSSKRRVIKGLYTIKKIKEGNWSFNPEEKYSYFLSKKYEIKKGDVPKYKENTLAVISYTGGTTGVHKGVKISNDGLNTLVFAHKYLVPEIHRKDIFMNIIPQFMIYGLFTLHLGLCLGLETHLILDSSPKKFVDYLIKINPAVAFGGPVHWETLIDNPKLKNNSLSNMKAPISGGEKISIISEKKVSEALLKSGSKKPLCNGFGASELGGSVTVNYGKDWEPGTVGKLHIFDNAKIIDFDTGEELPYDKEGKLLISTPALMMGYYNNPEEEKKVISVDEKGVRWFYTGDIAKMSPNGNITITGRSKRLFVCGVNNVYPPEMEELISKIPNVKKCAVVNVPDKELREVPKVHFVLKKDTEDERNEIKKLTIETISNKISDEVIPKYFEFHDELQYTPNGKIDFEGIRKNDLENLENRNLY